MLIRVLRVPLSPLKRKTGLITFQPMNRKPDRMRIELSTDDAIQEFDFTRGSACAVCGQPIIGPAALWLAVESMDFFLHKDCEQGFTPEIVKRRIGDMVLVMQDETLQDTPPEKN